ncbi:MAG: hypothetical protein GY860_13775 [Desulfobacteraceae bacterium]|nr:hypothetical protein [Desulfobacteraceae bacterium]
MENLFQALIPEGAGKILQEAVANGVYSAFIVVFMVFLISLGLVAFYQLSLIHIEHFSRARHLFFGNHFAKGFKCLEFYFGKMLF